MPSLLLSLAVDLGLSVRHITPSNFTNRVPHIYFRYSDRRCRRRARGNGGVKAQRVCDGQAVLVIRRLVPKEWTPAAPARAKVSVCIFAMPVHAWFRLRFEVSTWSVPCMCVHELTFVMVSFLDSIRRYACNFVPSKTYVNHSGIDEKTGTWSAEIAKTSNPRSKSVTMMRGRIAPRR